MTKKTPNATWDDAIEEAARHIEAVSVLDTQEADCFSTKPGSAAILADSVRKLKKKPDPFLHDRIKACPFCGSRTVEVCRTNKNACWIRCDECGAESPSAPKRADAIANWNRRAADGGAYATVIDDDDRRVAAYTRTDTPSPKVKAKRKATR